MPTTPAGAYRFDPAVWWTSRKRTSSGLSGPAGCWWPAHAARRRIVNPGATSTASAEPAAAAPDRKIRFPVAAAAAPPAKAKTARRLKRVGGPQLSHIDVWRQHRMMWVEDVVLSSRLTYASGAVEA